jgi:hypothetical protein
MKSKLCKGCNEFRLLTEFSKSKSEYDGLQRRCKQCNKSHNDKVKYKFQLYQPLYRDKNRKILNEKRREKERNKSIESRLIGNIRSRISIVVKKKGIVKSRKTKEIVGCNPNELINHLKSKFLTGMSIDNYGKWEIDHIIPISSAKSIDDIYRLNHYTNLQPLWKTDNARKSNKIETRHRT